MNYQILNYLGEEVIASVSQEELDVLKETQELNVFEWDGNEESHIITGFAAHKAAEPTLDLDNVRIYKVIEE